MERGVIETFDLLRPEVEPHFLMSYTTERKNLSVLTEIQRRGLRHSFFSDWTDWPRIGKPKSLKQAIGMTSAMLKGNRDVWSAASDSDVIYIASVNYFYFALVKALFGKLRARRLVFHFHDLLRRPSRQLKSLNGFITDYVHNTELSRVAATKANPFIEQHRNWVIPYPIVRDRVANDSNSRDHPSILFVGQVAKHKGVDLLLDAFERLQPQHPRLTLDVVGGCDEPDLVKRLAQLSANGKPGVRCWG